MNTNDIVLAIDAEISRLQQAKALLTDTSSLTRAKRKPGRPVAASGERKATSSKPAEFNVMSRKRRGMSDAGRARIAAAQKARWARFKKSCPVKRAARSKPQTPVASASQELVEMGLS